MEEEEEKTEERSKIGAILKTNRDDKRRHLFFLHAPEVITRALKQLKKRPEATVG